MKPLAEVKLSPNGQSVQTRACMEAFYLTPGVWHPLVLAAEGQSQNTADAETGVEDAALAKVLNRGIDALERQIDNVGDTPLRHALSQRIVEIRMLARDGHLRNMNGGKGPMR